MPGRQPLARALAFGGLVLALASVAGCGRTVAVKPPPSSDPACEALVAALPSQVAGQGQRDTESPGTAAWGSPPVVLRCGVPEPAALEPTSALLEVDGVAWFAEPLSNGTLFTAVGASPRVEVAVPAEQEPASGVLVDLADAVRRGAP